MATNNTSTPSALVFPLFLLLLPSVCFSISTVHLSSQANSTTTNGTDFIRTSCSATIYPDRCYKALVRYANTIQQSPRQLAYIAVNVSLCNARGVSAYVTSLHGGALEGTTAPRVQDALHACVSTLGDAVYQMRQSLAELRQIKKGGEFQFQMSNVETWMSAALTNEDTCTDGFEDLPPSATKFQVSGRVGRVKEMTSNALALVHSLASKQ